MSLHERIQSFSPKLRNTITKVWYRYLAGLPHARELMFMNFGYAKVKEADTEPQLSKEDEIFRLNIQLYHNTVRTTPLIGKNVVEVGCGRGGGSSYIARYLKPARMTGLDYVMKAVKYCRRTHKLDNLDFIQGDAMNLPYGENELDIVLNVESAHTYVSFNTFCKEVYRVLKPGALFLMTDIRDIKKIPTVMQDIKDAGFIILEEEDISSNALRSMQLDHERKTLMIKQKTPSFLHNTLLQFAGTKESWIYRWLEEGSFKYFRLKLQKAM